MRPLLLLHVFLIALAGCTGPARATDASAGPASSPDPLIATRKLYLNKCARCHKLYDPAKYSDADWQDWMTKMSRKAKLNPAQKETLVNYTDALRHASKTSADQTAPASGR